MIMNIQAISLLLCIGAALGQGIPSADECQRRVDSIGQNNILQILSSCTGSTPSAACCRAANDLLGFPGSGRLAGCLCNTESLQATLDQISSNSLARLAGVTRSGVANTLNQCNVPNADLEGSCPSAATTAPAATTSAANADADAESEDVAKEESKSETKAMADAKAVVTKEEPKSEVKSDGKVKVSIEKNDFWVGTKKCDKDCRAKLEEKKCDKDDKDCYDSLHGDDKGHFRFFHHGHPVLKALTGRRMLGAVEVKAPGAAVAVSKAGVIVETDRPVVKAVVEAKEDVKDHVVKTVDKVTGTVDVDDVVDKVDKVDKVVDVVRHDNKHSIEHRPVRRVVERVHDHHEAVVKTAIDVHKAVHKAVVDALRAKINFVTDIHDAKRDAIEDAHKAKSEAVVSVVAKHG